MIRFTRSVRHVFLASLMGTAASAAYCDVVETFSGNPQVGSEREAVAAIGMAPKSNDGSVLRLSWQQHEGKFVAGFIVPGAVLIDKPGKYVVTARVCLEMLGPECQRLALRVTDSSRETHQYTAKIVAGEPGWVDVSWVIDTENPQEGATRPWGGDGNGALDLPIRLRGFALPFSKGRTTGGELWVDEVSIKPFAG